MAGEDNAGKRDPRTYVIIGAAIEALVRLTNIEKAIIINYLKATGYEIGLLLNFGGPSLEHPRFIRSNSSAQSAKSADDPPAKSADGPAVEPVD